MSATAPKLAAETAAAVPAGDFDVPVEALRRRRGAKWSRFGPDVLPAWVADTDFVVAEPIRRAVAAATAASDLGYPDLGPERRCPPGLASAFVAWSSRRHGWEVEPERVEVLADVVQGIYVALETLSEPGDGVVVQPPVYPPFYAAVDETRRTLVENPLAPGPGRYELDLDGLRAAAARARVLLLCNPHNPTGRAFTRPELEAVAAVAEEHDLVVISDEIHADLVFPGARHTPFGALGPEAERRTVTLASASKAFGVPGLRCAVAVFGSDELQRRFAALPSHTRGGAGSLGLAATEAAWRDGGPWLDAALSHLDANRRLVEAFVAERLPGVVLRVPEATFLAWLDCRGLGLPVEPCEHFLERAKVALGEGPAFGAPGVGHVRLNFATSRAILTEVLERMAASLGGTGG